MGRIRTIKPEFWTDERLSELPEATHILAAALLNYADDEGFFNANERLIQAACCPLREPSVSVHVSLKALEKIGYVQFGKGTDGRRYGWVVSFEKHQRVNRPTASKIKALIAGPDDSLNTHGVVTEDSLAERGTGNGEQGIDLRGFATEERGGTAESYPGEFEHFWKAYPARDGRRRGKGKALKIWKREVRAAERQELIAAAANYAASDEAKRGFAKDPERFLKDRYWADWIGEADVRAASRLPSDEEDANWNAANGGVGGGL